MSLYDEQFLPKLKYYIDLRHEELSGHYGSVRDFIKVIDGRDHVTVAYTNKDTEVPEHVSIDMPLLELIKLL